MIEVIYEKESEKDDVLNEESSLTKQDLKLPKNIRQMGSPNPAKRIYIEDYVMTYLNFISKPGSTHTRVAVLLGEVVTNKNYTAIFVKGAVDCSSIEFDADEKVFTENVWSDIYTEIKNSFPSLSVVGWYLTRMGFTNAINDKITKLHMENFPGKEKILYIYDSLDSEDSFYMFERGEITKQSGYYIYYAKNDEMQEYMMKQKGDSLSEDEEKVNKKDIDLLKHFKEKNEKYDVGLRNESGNFVYIAGSLVVVAMLAMGITIINNYDKMKQMEISINRLQLAQDDNIAATVMVGDSTENGSSYDVSTILSENGENVSEMVNGSNLQGAFSSEEGVVNQNEVVTTVTNNDEQSDNKNVATNISDNTPTQVIDNEAIDDGGEDTQVTPVITQNMPTYYMVEEGDTLTSISLKFFDSVKYIEDIENANNMEDGDRIYIGQKIIIPGLE